MDTETVVATLTPEQFTLAAHRLQRQITLSTADYDSLCAVDQDVPRGAAGDGAGTNPEQ